MDLDFENMNLDEAFGSDFDSPADTEPPALVTEEVTPAAEGEDAPPPQAEQEPEDTQEKPKNWNPEGPGKPSVALRQAREEARVIREQNQALAARVAEFERQQAEIQRQREDEAFRAQLEDLSITDPDQAATLLYQRQQQSADAIRQEAEAQRIRERSTLSVEYARDAYPDFDEVVNGLMASPQANYVNWASIDAQPNPGKALYEYAKSVKPVDRDALKAELLAELKQSLTPAKPKAPALLGSLPAAAPNSGDGAVDLNSLTKRDFDTHGLDLIDLIS